MGSGPYDGEWNNFNKNVDNHKYEPLQVKWINDKYNVTVYFILQNIISKFEQKFDVKTLLDS